MKPYQLMIHPPANSLTNIFTEADDSILADGSLDPMGLRIIWTSLGEAIFKNRINTISNNIRLYTFNLFHHHLIRDFEKKSPSLFRKALGRVPYGNENDLREGLVIFLECLQAHIVLHTRDEYAHTEEAFVPGMSKLDGITRTRSNSPMATRIKANRNEGILVRQIGLGIHGRHKGPFTQMEIFGHGDYYPDNELWDGIADLFQLIPEWAELKRHVDQLLRQLLNGPLGKTGFEMQVVTFLDNEPLAKAYNSCFEPRVYQHPQLVYFWEDKLGLHKDTAKAIYQAVAADPEAGSSALMHAASAFAKQNVFRIEAILRIEPFLSMVNKIILRLLQRGTINVNQEIKTFVDFWLKKRLLLPDDHYISTLYLSEAACARLKKLVDICGVYEDETQVEDIVRQLLYYHQNILSQRGNLPWLSFSDGRIRLHRSYFYNQNQLADLSNDNWVNTYYIPSLQNIYKGLHRVS